MIWHFLNLVDHQIVTDDIAFKSCKIARHSKKSERKQVVQMQSPWKRAQKDYIRPSTVWCQVCIEQQELMYFNEFLAFCFFFFRTPTFLQGCLCLLFYSPKLYRSWQKFRSKWVSSMLSWKIAKEEPKKCNRLHVFFGICFWPTWDCGCLSQSKHTVESVSLCLFYRLLIVYLSICCLICCCHLSHLFIESILLSRTLNPITLILYVVKWNLLIDGF